MKNTGYNFRFRKYLSGTDFQEHFKNKINRVEKRLASRNGPYLKWFNEIEDDSKLVLPDKDFKTGIPTWSRAFNDYTAGLSVLAAQPNAGKSTVMISLMIGLMQLNDDVLIVDLSFDDPEEKRFTQFICNLSHLSYQDVGSLGGMTKEDREKYEIAKKQLEDWIDQKKFWMFSGGEETKVSDKKDPIEIAVQAQEQIIALMEDMRAEYPDKKIVFFIDAYNDIESEAEEYFSLDKVIKSLKSAAIENSIVCMMAAHVRKTQDRNARRGRLSLDDIKGTKELEFSSVWAGVLVNEWKQNAIAEPLLLRRNEKIFPIIAIEPQKSKVSAWTKPLYYGLDEFRCRIIPLTRAEYLDAHARYNRMERD